MEHYKLTDFLIINPFTCEIETHEVPFTNITKFWKSKALADLMSIGTIRSDRLDQRISLPTILTPNHYMMVWDSIAGSAEILNELKCPYSLWVGTYHPGMMPILGKMAIVSVDK